jgi:tetratricopeptide (TPR) repeat protein
MMQEHPKRRPPSLRAECASPVPTSRAMSLLEPLLEGALAAQRSGTLAALLHQRPRLTRGFARRLLAPLRRVTGGAASADDLAPAAWLLLLRALLAELRPDDQPGLDGISEAMWQHPSADWRALLALACHHGVLVVPTMPGVYRARAGDAPADQLCGLWDVAPSTFYRSIDKGRHRLMELLLRTLHDGPAAIRHLLALQHEVHRALQLHSPASQTAWHRERAAHALQAQDGVGALWHLLRAGDAAGVIACVRRFAVALARCPDTDALLRQASHLPMDVAGRVQLSLAEAALARVRGDAPGERGACEQALRLAHATGDALLLGRAFGALGRYHEVRDPARAFVCLQDSTDYLHQAGVPELAAQDNDALLDEYANTLVRLAWWYLLHHDPRAGPLIDRAQAMQDHSPRAIETQALLSQVAGEYWRRSGQLGRALECKYRALHLYQRLGDQQGILKTYGNLSLIHGEAKDFARAIEASQHVLEMADRFSVEPETVAATHLNLGAAYFWQNRWDHAIEQYDKALAMAEQHDLGVLVWRGHYNLAEAYYKRFQAFERADDELQGDAHSSAALAAWPAQTDPSDTAPAEAARRLKRDILGPRDEDGGYDRLLPGEFAAHFPELLAVQRQRAALSLPLAPPEQVAAHLAIAGAYLAVSVKERAAAAALIQRHGLGDRFQVAFDALRNTFAEAQGRREQLVAHWHQHADDLLRPVACAALLDHLLANGTLTKSRYAPLCGVGLATASKQLGLLAERGLLVQLGRGPSTRYQLPAGP